MYLVNKKPYKHLTLSLPQDLATVLPIMFDTKIIIMFTKRRVKYSMECIGTYIHTYSSCVNNHSLTAREQK